MSRSIIAFFIATLLFAGEYITLENGKVIELKSDGTWQEVKVVKKGKETIAIKPDGTWEKVEATKVEAANALERAVDKKYKDEPIIKKLLGKWEGDGISYTFTKDRAVFKKRVGHTTKVVEGKWIIEKFDKKKRVVKINIGEGARLGFITFGGIIRKLKIKDDNTIIDMSDQLEEGKTYTLKRL